MRTSDFIHKPTCHVERIVSLKPSPKDPLICGFLTCFMSSISPVAEALSFHQTVCTLEVRIRPSRLIAGTPKYTAVAATMRSGISGMSTRGTSNMASIISDVTGAS
jgi:hypothetical protein